MVVKTDFAYGNKFFFAAKLVYEISKRIISLGKTPALYTDGDYTASNSCYTGIGYMKVGSLCTIGIE